MAKAVLEFDLKDPKELIEYTRCNKSLDMACALFQIQVNLKKSCEDGDIDTVFEKINDIFNDYNLNIDTLLD